MRDPRVAEMIRIARIEDGDHGRAGISPFKLALLADIVRVHDVPAMARVARMTDAVVRGAPEKAQTWPGGPER